MSLPGFPVTGVTCSCLPTCLQAFLLCLSRFPISSIYCYLVTCYFLVFLFLPECLVFLISFVIFLSLFPNPIILSSVSPLCFYLCTCYLLVLQRLRSCFLSVHFVFLFLPLHLFPSTDPLMLFSLPSFLSSCLLSLSCPLISVLCCMLYFSSFCVYSRSLILHLSTLPCLFSYPTSVYCSSHVYFHILLSFLPLFLFLFP